MSINRASIDLLRDIWTGMLDLVYPPKCLVCGAMPSKYLCDQCISEIQFIHPPICHQCGMPIDETGCRECRGVEFAFNSARAAGVYDGVLKDAIHRFKYSGHKVLGPVLGEMMTECLRTSRLLNDVGCVVPMPIHPSRLRQRGFNQSELLARVVTSNVGLPLLHNVLARSVRTSPQVNLPMARRRENVENAFEVIRPGDVTGRAVLLIDDVLTTGSTSDSAARALRAAGAREIHVLTLARDI